MVTPSAALPEPEQVQSPVPGGGIKVDVTDASKPRWRSAWEATGNPCFGTATCPLRPRSEPGFRIDIRLRRTGNE